MAIRLIPSLRTGNRSGLYIRSVNKEKWGKGRIGEMAQTFSCSTLQTLILVSC
ncbi:MAG: hypothetical protein AB1414_19985 [bacterium]